MQTYGKHESSLGGVTLFYKERETKNLSEESKKLATEYHENGFVVVPGLFNEALIDSVKTEARQAFDPSVLLKTYRDERRIQDFGWSRNR